MKMKSIVVIGMRGAGKSTFGRVGSSALGPGWHFVDLDEVLESREGCSCGDVIERVGWDGFRTIELQVLKDCMQQYPEKTVLSCGGGIVETEPAREVLKRYAGPVVHVERSIDDIIDYLERKEMENDATTNAAESLARRPKYGQSIREVFERRYAHFLACSTHHFYIPKGEMNWDRITALSGSFLASIYYPITPDVLIPNATIKVYEPSTTNFDGYDAVLLVPTGDTKVEDLVARFRLASSLPLILDCGDNVETVKTGLEMNAEIIRVNDESIVCKALEECPRWLGTTRFMVTVSKLETALPKPFTYASCLCITNTTFQGAQDAVFGVTRLMDGNPGKAICIDESSCKGDGLELARALVLSFGGPTFNLTGSLVDLCRKHLHASLLDHYCLFGSPIQSSPSPAMHNAGFTAMGLRKRYTLCDTLDLEKVRSVMQSTRFMGASVTIPHKEGVVQYMDILSDAAKEIGAVNTVAKLDDGRFFGDNTDWFGIFQLIRKAQVSSGSALVIGAGGTALAACYCVKHLGMDLLIYNRTKEKAERVAKRFEGSVVEDLNSLKKVAAIISTVPASSHFTMPNETLLETCKPVVIDVAYRPRRTKLLDQASRLGCQTFEGIDMLVQQGLQQMRVWTNVDVVPADEMEFAARNFYVETDPNAERYYLFGYPISTSPSPTMHNTGFLKLGLSKIYGLCQSEDIAVVEAKLRDESFKGASVTIPHKEAVMPFMNSLSDSAKKIGAVNTIIRRPDDTLFGDNTDWLGIKALIEKSDLWKQGSSDKRTALVIGAGGTSLAACYCAKELGMDLYIFNRTVEKAERLAKQFMAQAVGSLDALSQVSVDFIISTVPSSSEFTIPDHLCKQIYETDNKPVVIDVAYRPKDTLLLKQAQTFGCETFPGIEMLIEQGLEQLKRWTDRSDVPREAIQRAVYKFYHQI